MKYAYIKDPKMYERTFEFKEAWDWSTMKKDIHSISTYLWYDDSKVRTFDPDKFIHGSKYSTPEYVGANLPAILEGKQSSLWLSVAREGKFWELFIEEMFNNGELERITTEHFTKNGFIKS